MKKIENTLHALNILKITKSPKNTFEENTRSDIRITLIYINHTGKEIFVSCRSGRVLVVPARSTLTDREFIIREEIQLSGKSRDALLKKYQSSNVRGLKSVNLREFYNALKDVMPNENGTLTIKLDHHLPMTSFRELNGNVFVEDFDIILSLDQNNIPTHPAYRTREVLEDKRKYGHEVHEFTPTKGLMLYLVDPDKTLGDMYVYSAGMVNMVEHRNLPMCAVGLYVQYPDDRGRGERTYYSPEEISKLKWVHRTREEAASHAIRDGDIAVELQKAKLATKKDTINEVEKRGQLDLVKIELEKEILLRKSIEERFASERAKDAEENERMLEALDREYKSQQLEVKDLYEARSHKRKDTTEVIKVVPTILAGALTAFVAMKALL